MTWLVNLLQWNALGKLLPSLVPGHAITDEEKRFEQAILDGSMAKINRLTRCWLKRISFEDVLIQALQNEHTDEAFLDYMFRYKYCLYGEQSLRMANLEPYTVARKWLCMCWKYINTWKLHIALAKIFPPELHAIDWNDPQDYNFPWKDDDTRAKPWMHFDELRYMLARHVARSPEEIKYLTSTLRYHADKVHEYVVTEAIQRNDLRLVLMYAQGYYLAWPALRTDWMVDQLFAQPFTKHRIHVLTSMLQSVAKATFKGGQLAYVEFYLQRFRSLGLYANVRDFARYMPTEYMLEAQRMLIESLLRHGYGNMQFGKDSVRQCFADGGPCMVKQLRNICQPTNEYYRTFRFTDEITEIAESVNATFPSSRCVLS